MEGSGLLVGGKGGKRSGRGTTRRSLAETLAKMSSAVSGVGLQQMHGGQPGAWDGQGHGPERDVRRDVSDARAFLAAPRP